MNVQVVLHEVLYQAHTDGLEREKKTLSVQARIDWNMESGIRGGVT